MATILFCLQSDEEQKLAVIRKAFQMFDTSKSGFIETIKIATILNTMGQIFDEVELNNLITKEDPDRSGKVDFDGFCAIASHFLEEDADDESTQQELKEAFRLVKIFSSLNMLIWTPAILIFVDEDGTKYCKLEDIERLLNLAH